MGVVIAIDGTAAAGKGVLSRFIAREYGFHCLDTGLIYRAVAANILDANISLDDEVEMVKVAQNIVLSYLNDKVQFSSHAISKVASHVATISSVRHALIDIQRSFAQKEPGVVLDGRDIGTVVCPNARVKFYVTASLNVRARRRYNEMLACGEEGNYIKVLEDLQKRDTKDKERDCCPLVQAKDAYFFDTSVMSIGTMCKVAKGLVDTKLYSG
ncbi:cytidylate kinase [Candidatus Liberibacter solanacearum]|uniref:Cytidylate kinase n=1 Tax=Candidatus Liberibacter solanacearum TaxID=556287 RepID=A0A095BGH7_9HYPH|nr:(d)CMP kinase [Candidatus Liberibacter solanacearum]KGB27903.1 cytidylate kinase [Candidatus Liberibacter solanacearum]KJZ81038.1 cytidylate kinase [Candidatus Liberibacter solanacearum]KJZ82218.1 Cytidylate kinase [Candidatus Liberibacter solanacearum]KQC49361.1 cytidylate kinase [Candidatus Liberibacter solanacearum]